MENNKLKFFGVVAVQVAIILAMIFYKFVILSGGTPVFLAIEPIDPRDPLRGDYMVFKFRDISTIDSYYFSQDTKDDYFSGASTFEPKVGEEVYVNLENYSNYYLVSGVYPTKPKDGVFIKGRVKYIDVDSTANDYYGPKKYEIEYGVENYFIPENTGREMSFQNNRVEAEVLVDENGSAVLKSLYVDGKKWP